jgi:hypothetical protein
MRPFNWGHSLRREDAVLPCFYMNEWRGNKKVRIAIILVLLAAALYLYFTL